MDSLIGIKLKDWIRLLKENGFNISPGRWPRAAIIAAIAARNSRMANEEEQKYGADIEKTTIEKAPLFVVGHWRSGTTFLNNILAQDEQFAYPTVFENNHPHIFIDYGKKLQKVLQERHRRIRPTDNVEVKPLSPGEEEFAVAVITLLSPMLGWVFPKNADSYERTMTFENVGQEERRRWQQGYLWYLKKQTFVKKKQLLLKSPLNTARIGLLRHLFSAAKFIHIHRNPYDVFKSTRKLYKTAVHGSSFQKNNGRHNTQDILERYENMYRKFFEDFPQLKVNQRVDIAYEDVASKPLETLEQIYDSLKLPDFDLFLPRLEKHLKAHSGYKKNKHARLEESEQKVVAQKWQRSFEHWNYPL